MASRNEAKIIFKAVTDQFEQGIKQAKSTISGLNAQLRLNAQEMAKGGNSAQLMEQRVSLLTQKEREQENVVGNLERKLAVAKERFGDNSDEVQKLSTNLTNAKATLQSYSNQTEQARQKLAQSKTAYGQTSQAIKEQEAELKRLKQEYANVVVAEGKNSASAKELEGKIKSLSTELGQNKEKLQLADDAADKLGNSYRTAAEKSEALRNKLDKIGTGMQSAGQAMTAGITLPIIAAGAATVKVATDIDTALTGVKKTVDGTEEQYQELKAAAIEFSQTNAVDPSQILDIQALGAQLGFTIEELDEFGRVVSGLDIATNMDAETAATEMAQFANITKMSHSDISKYGSAIVGLGNNFATTEKDVSSMAMRIAASGTQVGLSQADILGLATALASMGVEAEAGGTAISTVMAQIDKDIALNSDAVETWASAAGKSAGDFANAWKNDPVQALSDLFAGMESATTEGSNMSLMLDDLGINSLRQTDIMKRLAGNSELVGSAVSKSNEEWEKNTALQAEVDNRNESLAAKFEILKNKAIAVADKVGGPLAEALLSALEAAEPLLESIADGAQAFADMDEEQQRTILTVVGLVAALGPLLSVTGGVVRGAKELSSVFGIVSGVLSSFNGGGAASAMSTIAGEAGDASGKTDALGVATEVAGTKAEGATGKLASFASKAAIVGAAAYASAEATRSMFSANADAGGKFDESAEKANTYAATLGTVDANADGVIDSADLIAQALDGAESKFDDGGIAIEGFAKKMGEVGESSKGAMGVVNDYFGVVEDNVSLAMRSITSATQQGWGAALAATQSTGGEVSQETRDQALAMVEAMNQLPEKYGDYGDEAMRSLAATMAPYWPELADYSGMSAEQIGTVIKDRLSGAVSEGGEGFHLAGENAVDQLASGLQFAADGGVLDEATAQSVQQLLNGFSSEELPRGMQQAGTDSMRSLASGLSSQWPELANYANMSGDQIIQAISARLDGTYQEGAEGGNATGQGYADALANKKDAAIASALEVTGMTIEQFNASAAQAGIEGDEATAAYATHLGAGMPTAEAAAAAVAAGSTAGLGTGDGATPGTTTAQNYVSAVAAEAGNAHIQGSLTASSATAGLGTGDGTTPGSRTGAAFASGVGGQAGNANAQGSTTARSATSGLGTGDGATPGSTLGGRFASGVGGASGAARGSGRSVAGAAQGGMQSNSGSAGTWGSHLVQNFASGISGAISWVQNAASSVASVVAGILGHTVPKEGILHEGGRGEVIWGEHLAQNIAAGMRNARPEVEGEAMAIADVLGDIANPAVLDWRLESGSISRLLPVRQTEITSPRAGDLSSAITYAEQVQSSVDMASLERSETESLGKILTAIERLDRGLGGKIAQNSAGFPDNRQFGRMARKAVNGR